MDFLRKTTFLLLCSFSFSFVYPNAGAPGFYGIGGLKEMMLFYPKDSLLLSKIQMKSELVTILLYKGFAVVKGEYYFLNLSDSAIKIHTGYPVNSYQGNEFPRIDFTSLYKMSVFIDGQEVPVKDLSREPDLVQTYDSKNWYVWECSYKPKTITKITVYFIVNTNNATVRSGYNLDKVNGFAYLLESGRAWANKIDSGRIYIKLMDNLQIKDISGISPNGLILSDNIKNELVYDFKDLEPGASNNILIKYYERQDDFNFEEILKKSKDLFKEIDKLNGRNISANGYKPLTTKDVFNVEDSSGGGMLYIIIGIVAIPVLLIIGIVVFVIWLFRRKNRKTK